MVHRDRALVCTRLPTWEHFRLSPKWNAEVER
jgi:hypothetical protein